MASRMKEVREPHWAVPHLYRVRRPATDLYPYLPTERATAPQRKQQQRLLSDAERGSVSPLGGTGVAQPTSKGKG
jgi:hypothetical protein